jgi:hypothetical protein
MFSMVLCNSLFAQKEKSNTLLEKLNMIIQKEKKEDFSKKDSLFDDKSITEKRFYNFWISKLDKSGNATEYARYFADKYAKLSNIGITTNTCLDNCNNTCYNHNWRYFGPEKSTPINQLNKEIQVNGIVPCIWVHPTNDQNIRLGSRAGLWETKDGGNNWISLTDGCLSGIGVNYIAVQPDNPNIIYISTGLDFWGQRYGYGIYKSIDGGATWQRLNVFPITDVVDNISSKILIHPNNYSILYAIVGYKVYKSIDFGITWNVIFSDLMPANSANKNTNKLFLRDLEIVPNGSIDNIYISSENRTFCEGLNYSGTGPCNGCIPSSGTSYYIGTCCLDPNNGYSYCTARYSAMTWRIIIPRTGIGNIPFTPAAIFNLKNIINYPNQTALSLISITNTYIYTLTYNDDQTTGKIYRANKLGGPFTLLFNLPALYLGTNAPSGCTFDVSPNETNIYVGGTQLFKQSLSSATATFSQAYGYFDYTNNASTPHPDVRSALVYKSTANPNQDVLFIGTDGGISKSINSGTTFTNLNGNGLQLTDVWGISNSEKYPNLVAFGTQDNGLFFNSTHNWNWTYFGDGYDCITDNNNPHDIIGSNNGIGPIKINGLTGFQTSFSPSQPGGNCEFFQDNLSNLYVGKNKTLTKYNAATNSGSVVVSNFPNSKGGISGLGLTKSNDIGLVCFDGITWGTQSSTGIVYKIIGLTTNPTVSDITNGLDAFVYTSATDLAIEPILGNKLWVSFSGLWDINRKVMMYENNQWVQFGQGLPNIPVNALEYYEGSNDLIFAGTDEGVYYRDASMSSWQKFSCGLPNVIITDLEINYKLKQLRAATFGRGVWITQIPIK